jgi:hypothetical protein
MATESQFLPPVAIGQEAVVANALEALGQDMEQESTDELFGIQVHGFDLTAMAIVFPVELNPAIIDADQAMVGNGYAMGVAADIIEHLLWSGERRLGVDYPFAIIGVGEMFSESAGIA